MQPIEDIPATSRLAERPTRTVRAGVCVVGQRRLSGSSVTAGPAGGR
jgi:hypothetical protein